MSSKGNNLSDDELGNTAGVCEWGVEDSNPVLCSIVEVNLIRANAEASYHDQVLGFTEDSSIEFGL